MEDLLRPWLWRAFQGEGRIPLFQWGECQKLLEEKKVEVQDFLGPDKARAVVKRAMERYVEEFPEG